MYNKLQMYNDKKAPNPGLLYILSDVKQALYLS